MTQVTRATAVKLLGKIDRLEADLNALEEFATRARNTRNPEEEERRAAEFAETLAQYEGLVARMVASPLWPDSVADLRALVRDVSPELPGYDGVRRQATASIGGGP